MASREFSNLEMTGLMFDKLVVEWDGSAYWTQAPPQLLVGPDRTYYQIKLPHGERVSIVVGRPAEKRPANVWWDKVCPASMPRISGRVVVMRHWGAINAACIPKFSTLNIISETDNVKWPK